MKSKNNINKIQSKDIDALPKTPQGWVAPKDQHAPGNKKPNVNVNTYMKKSKRNSNKENNVDITSDVIVIPELPEVVIPDIKPDIIPEFAITPDIVSNIKALNLIKAREIRKENLKNKNTSREEKILNLINEIKEEELLKIENKTNKLKNKLMKLI